MPQLSIVYWRDIPAQVVVGAGRKAARRPLSERFTHAIDHCAMKVGAKDDEAYIAQWRRGAPIEIDGPPDSVADAAAARIEADFDAEALRALIANDGWRAA